MTEPCPPNLDEDGRALWEQTNWILGGGAVSPDASLQMQALYIRRELRFDSELIVLRELLQKTLLFVEVYEGRTLDRNRAIGEIYAALRRK